jgi:hypothetical protein
MLQLVVPALFQADEFLDLLGEARLPGLDRLLVRGRRELLNDASLEALLCRELVIARQLDWPLAPITLAQAGGHPGNDYWLRADPVHVRIERDRLILSEIIEPSPDEARTLCEALAAHFGESFSPLALRPGAWVVHVAGTPALTTTPLSQAVGQHIDPLLPAGGDALQWRKLINEAQMLLFSHPLNQAREARGQTAINSLWLWGGGRLPVAEPKTSRSVFCSHPDWHALAAHAGTEARMLPDTWNPQLPDDALIVLDAPHRLLRLGDLSGWLQAMRDIDNGWLRPLLSSGRPFRVEDPLLGQRIHWRSAYHWKFWKRRQLSSAKVWEVQAPADSGIDAFGNRYQ